MRIKGGGKGLRVGGWGVSAGESGEQGWEGNNDLGAPRIARLDASRAARTQRLRHCQLCPLELRRQRRRGEQWPRTASGEALLQVGTVEV